MPLIPMPGPPVYMWTDEQRRQAGLAGQGFDREPQSPAKGDDWIRLSSASDALVGAILLIVAALVLIIWWW